LLVIVNDLHLLWPSIGPHEADPPLVVDSDAVDQSTAHGHDATDVRCLCFRTI
jgi:hypothetical protein